MFVKVGIMSVSSHLLCVYPVLCCITRLSIILKAITASLLSTEDLQSVYYFLEFSLILFMPFSLFHGDVIGGTVKNA